MGILDKLTKKKDQQKEAAEKKQQAVSEIKEKVSEKKTKNKTAAKMVEATANFSQPTVLVHPIVSEKTALGEAEGQYTFVVENDANKIEIKKAIKQLYGVTPAKVRVINMPGKDVRFGRIFGKRKAWKKAIVILPQGKRINIHEGV